MIEAFAAVQLSHVILAVPARMFLPLIIYTAITKKGLLTMKVIPSLVKNSETYNAKKKK